MNVLFFEPFGIYTPHLETSLDIVQEYLDKGASITFIGCDASLPICEPNPDHDLSLCLQCISKRKQGLKLLEGLPSVRYISLDSLDGLPHGSKILDERRFSNVEELKRFTIDQYDIGMAVVSSLMSLYRTPEPDLIAAKEQVARFFDASCRTYYKMRDYLLKNRPDKVFIFNGRFSFLRSVFRICQEYGIDCFTHERGSNISRYAVYENVLPHDIAFNVKAIRESWARAPGDRRVALAEQFYYDRVGAKQQSWVSFVVNQEKGLLPAGWDSKKKNLALFNSSEDEFSAIGEEWMNPLYPTQLEGVRKIVRDLSSQDNVHLYLRMHPNLADVHNKSVEELYRIRGNNFSLIPPKSKVSTYALIRASNKVITFGSTVGIEAAFWGKPSILAGMSFYNDLGSVYLPRSHEELIQMTLSDLQPKDRTGALMYGYYYNTFGREFKHFKADGVFSGTFKGKRIKPPLILQVMSKLVRVTRLQKLSFLKRCLARRLKGVS